MLAIGNSTLSNPVTNFKSSQPPSITPQAPVNFVELHNPLGMPCMRSRAQRRAAEKQAMKMTRVGGPNLHRPELDRAALVNRIRRVRHNESALSVRNVSPEPASALCEEFARAYNYADLTALASGLIDQFAAGMYSLSEYLPALHIGPPIAEAASIRPKVKNNKQDNVGSFIASFKKDFDIRMSADLASGDSLKGVTVIMGELHNHFVIRQQITDVLKRVQAENGDLLLCEGGAIICKKSSKIFKVPIKSCVSIEEDFPAYHDSKKLALDHEKKLLKEVEFIQSRIKPRPTDVDKSDALTYTPFIEKYWRLLPEKYMPEYQSLMISSKKAGYMAMDFVESQNGPRERNMMEKINQHHHPESTNFVLVGGAHLFNLFNDLSQSRGGKVVMMMPYAVYETFPKLSLPLERHDEL